MESTLERHSSESLGHHNHLLNFFDPNQFQSFIRILKSQDPLKSKDSLFHLFKTLDSKDPYTCMHMSRVQYYCEKICHFLECTDTETLEITLAGYLHDIGKMGVRDEILLKPGALSLEEWKEMKSHSNWGYEMVRSFPSLHRVALLLKHHHERIDGTGYPDGLKGEQIPFGSQVIAVADAFDAMTTDRPYRKAMSGQTALEILKSEEGIQFDPLVVRAFENVYADLEKINPRDYSNEGCPSSIPLVAFEAQWHGLMT